MLTAKSHANELMVYDEFVYFLLACHACMSVNKCAYGLFLKKEYDNNEAISSEELQFTISNSATSYKLRHLI